MRSSEHVAESLARAHQHWTTHPERAGHPGPFTIAVSRQAGTYGAAIARDVADRLGWPVYDRELLQRIAEDTGLHRSLLESVDERQPNWLSECISHFFSVSAVEVNESMYFHKLVETMLSLGRHGRCVIVGRAATNILPPATTLRVRIVAPLEHRIAAVEREHNITCEEAAARIEMTDRDRDRFVTSHFQIDPANPMHYDLVLNAARFSREEGADMILRALELMQSRPEEHRPLLEMQLAKC